MRRRVLDPGRHVNLKRNCRRVVPSASGRLGGEVEKVVSRWECGSGYPDITLLEPLASALGVSVAELLAGADVSNANRSANALRSKLYVCPMCGNVLSAMGEAVVSCCGIALPPLEAEPAEGEHAIDVELVEDELYVSLAHPCRKSTRVVHRRRLARPGAGRQALPGGRRRGKVREVWGARCVRLLQPARAVPREGIVPSRLPNVLVWDPSQGAGGRFDRFPARRPTGWE